MNVCALCNIEGSTKQICSDRDRASYAQVPSCFFFNYFMVHDIYFICCEGVIFFAWDAVDAWSKCGPMFIYDVENNEPKLAVCYGTMDSRSLC